MEQVGTLTDSSLFQAHAQAWHAYNDTWRSQQQGESRTEGPEDRVTRERYHSACHPLLFLLRSGGDLIKLRLGGACGP